jgi:hypothetical protein
MGCSLAVMISPILSISLSTSRPALCRQAARGSPAP